MPTIKLGDRDLDVKEATIGFWERVREMPSGADGVGKIVDLFTEALDHNEGITRQWIADRLPLNGDKLRARFTELLEANGMAPKEKPPEGEPAAR